MPMKRSLGWCAVALALAGCGSSSSSSAVATEPRTVAILSATAAGGEVSEVGVVLGGDAAVSGFVESFEQRDFAAEVQAVASSAELEDGEVLVAATIAIGCDVPPGVAVSREGDHWLIVPKKVIDPHLECFAPVTSVALVAVPTQEK